MEAMAGAMTVCLALMSFTAYVAADALNSDSGPVEFDDSILDMFCFADGSLVMPSKDYVAEYLENNNLSGIKMKISSFGELNHCYLIKTWGAVTSDSSSERHLFSLTCDDGTTLPMVAEVVLFR